MLNQATFYSRISSLGLGLALGLYGNAQAWANPRALPFTYPYQTLAQGETEIEQYVDYVPVKVLSTSTGLPVYYGATQFQTEVEYGLTDRLELGLYFTFAPTGGDGYNSVPVLTEGTGLKQRLRYRLGEEGQWPVDVALYGEIVETQAEFEGEAKILLQRRGGRLSFLVNLWAEREYYYDGRKEWVINPTAGATYEINPIWHVGVEYWMRAEFPDNAPASRPFNLGPNSYLGPTVMGNFGRIWWSTGVYERLNKIERSPQVGDAFGQVWIRTVLGVNL